MKDSIPTICPLVNTHRMVKDYTPVYLKAHDHYRTLEEDNAARAKALAIWIARLHGEWSHVRVEAVKVRLGPSSTDAVTASNEKPSIAPIDRFHRRHNSFDKIASRIEPPQIKFNGDILRQEGTELNACAHLSFCPDCPRSGMHGFTVRIRPDHPDLSVLFLRGLICWADAARIGT
jgi:hypothetical protein